MLCLLYVPNYDMDIFFTSRLNFGPELWKHLHIHVCFGPSTLILACKQIYHADRKHRIKNKSCCWIESSNHRQAASNMTDDCLYSILSAFVDLSCSGYLFWFFSSSHASPSGILFQSEEQQHAWARGASALVFVARSVNARWLQEPDLCYSEWMDGLTYRQLISFYVAVLAWKFCLKSSP